jgi:predicted permease
MEGIRQDLLYAARQYKRTKALTLIVIVTIALGIGANTALFSIVNGVLLNPLNYPQPEQLMTLHASRPNFQTGSISYPNFRDWQRQNHTFSAVAIFRPVTFSLTGAGDAVQLNGEYVTSDFFSILATKPLLGRTFAAGEDEIGAAPVAIIGEALWRSKFGSSTLIVGQPLNLDGRSYNIIGVIPASFSFPMAPFALVSRDVFVPVGQWKNNLLNTRGAGLGLHGIGRLKPGVTAEQAIADMDRVASNLAVAYPVNQGVGAKIIPMKQWMVGSVRTPLLVLFASVGLVLLIVCVNVASLLLARFTARWRELAIRSALGASQARLVRQLLTETVALAFVGGALGLFIAAVGTQAGLRMLPTTLPRAEEVGIDGRVLIFTLFISALTGILIGSAPMLKMGANNLLAGLKEASPGAAGSRHRIQGLFVVAEIAMALVLLSGAGLMIRTLQSLWAVDPGFDAENVLTVGVSLPPSMMTAPPEAVRAAFRQFDEKVAAIPGVQAISQTWGALPLSGDDEQTFWLDSEPKPANEKDMKWTIDYIVEPAYLQAMGLRLQQGRFFTPRDDEKAPRVIVVDDVFAKTYFPGQDPIGKRIRSDNFEGASEIVGVVGHVRQWGLDLDDTQKLRAQMYLPCFQMSDAFLAMTPSGSTAIVRTNGAVTLEQIRSSAQQLSNEHVLFAPQTMRQIISDSLARRRFMMILLGAFAGLALVLAIIGIYGVMSYIVGLRTHEIGIRMALGARRGNILLLVLRDAGFLTLQGVALGLVAAVALTRLIAKLLYGVGPSDPLTFTIVPAMLLCVALLASYLPARRAAGVDPMRALRSE